MTTVTGDWLTAKGTQRLFSVYDSAGHQLFAVGGCVRNALLAEPVSDIDMASDAPPDIAAPFLERAGLKVIPTGLDHGTLTVISDGTSYEITTYRQDVDTDGRHADVRFSNTLSEDAQRRDFTINALYADRDGRVTDPVGGLEDISKRRVRFVGQAEARIQEDYLRVLRFFRFHARYADPGLGVDADTLAAIDANLDGLERLSRERIGAELIKLLSAPDPLRAVAIMENCGVLARVLPGATVRAFGPFLMHEGTLALTAEPVSRLAAIADPDAASTLRLSKAQLSRVTTLRNAAQGTMSPAELGYRLGSTDARAAIALRFAFLEQPLSSTVAQDVQSGADSQFPIQAKDLMPAYQGAALGTALRALESKWIASGFSLTRNQLLS